jgi:uncharacterized membrane protein
MNESLVVFILIPYRKYKKKKRRLFILSFSTTMLLHFSFNKMRFFAVGLMVVLCIVNRKKREVKKAQLKISERF